MRNYTIYAVDFDGTLCESVWPGIGAPNEALISHLIKRRKQGNKIILWTCRMGSRLQEAVDWCRKHDLEFDAVNDNIPESVAYWGANPRKVFADVYIDDKLVNKPAYHIPYHGGEETSDLPNGCASENSRSLCIECMSDLCMFNPKGICLAPLVTGQKPEITEDGCRTCRLKEEI